MFAWGCGPSHKIASKCSDLGSLRVLTDAVTTPSRASPRMSTAWTTGCCGKKQSDHVPVCETHRARASADVVYGFFQPLVGHDVDAGRAECQRLRVVAAVEENGIDNVHLSAPCGRSGAIWTMQSRQGKHGKPIYAGCRKPVPLTC